LQAALPERKLSFPTIQILSSGFQTLDTVWIHLPKKKSSKF
jgi:hypothetical protein